MKKMGLIKDACQKEIKERCNQLTFIVPLSVDFLLHRYYISMTAQFPADLVTFTE